MDGNDRRRTQYGPPYQSHAPSRPLPGEAMGPPSGDRFTQPATPARTDIGRPSMTRPYLSGYTGYGYQEPQYGSSHLQSSSPMQGVEMQYSPAYLSQASRQQQVQASPSQQQHQPFSQYAASTMLPPVGPQGLYESIPFQQRQTALEVMTSQFAMPQYMQQSEHAGATLSSGPAQYLTSQPEQSSYGHVAVTRPPIGQSYAAGHVDFPVMEQAEPEAPAVLSGVQAALEQGLRDYHQQLRATFDAIIAGRVTAASEKLLALSRWLVNSVTALGLHHDDETRHAERIDFWRELNLCWEALGQKQKEITEEALRTKRQPVDVLSAEAVTSLVEELVSMCDQLEQYGLVDFEMGIWEEQIVRIFSVCLDLLPRGGLKRQSNESPS
ncbi:uncharacterized protein A1O5_04411 [Cladophialophora psammophila CBS 110553]|uniref:Uncharacterized protein n=1 Tax=Cladophialophora psammophila CBS 110553 TaxID=1182543 RepID=W9X3Q1_9EURO|nr:uncharacterized protein A1O5_04411 [Cladophialophora psammophila CBS 110553]EXJ71910.1 hypothetical protein A1O5_04411 [Cladophialophora psammophila CBS 110553]